MNKHVDVEQVAEIIGVTPQTIRRWCIDPKKEFPKPDSTVTYWAGKSKGGWNKQYWLRSEIEEWKAKHIVT